MRLPTAKGYLEPLTADHSEHLFELIHSSREHLYPWLPWIDRIHSPADTRVFIKTLCDEKGPQFAIKVNGELCGSVGFYILDHAQQFATLGYWLGTEYMGHGIMSDAVKTICHYGYSELDLRRIEVRSAESNVQSRNLPEKLGFYFEGIIANAEWLGDQYVDHACYTLLRPEFYARFGKEFEQPSPAQKQSGHR